MMSQQGNAVLAKLYESYRSVYIEETGGDGEHSLPINENDIERAFLTAIHEDVLSITYIRNKEIELDHKKIREMIMNIK